MADPFLGEIRIVGFNYAPPNWAFCQGQLLGIPQYSALYTLLGTMYGGNGTTNFALPNLQSRIPICMGTGGGLSPYQQGQTGGVEKVTLSVPQLPSHFHNITGMNSAPSTTDPTGAYLSNTSSRQATGPQIYNTNASGQVTMAQMCQPVGGNQPVATLPPYLALNFIIALVGIYPSRQ